MTLGKNAGEFKSRNFRKYDCNETPRPVGVELLHQYTWNVQSQTRTLFFVILK